MSDQDSKLPDIAYVSELAKLFKRFGLDELEIETGDQRISMRRGDLMLASASVATPAPLAASAAPIAATTSLGAPPSSAVEVEGSYITSPFVGTFYGRPRPNTPEFVKIGDTVSAGTTVCIVEAMKLFNEIEAEFGCVIEEVLVADQSPVEFGTKLFRVRRL
jgi:acetyl-CoA carboxylase biotin carboxyl carrier protein